MTEFSRAWPLYLEQNIGTDKVTIIDDICETGMSKYIEKHRELSHQPEDSDASEDGDDEIAEMERKLAAMKAAKNQSKMNKNNHKTVEMDHKKVEASTNAGDGNSSHSQRPLEDDNTEGKLVPVTQRTKARQAQQEDTGNHNPVSHIVEFTPLLYTFSEDLPDGCELRVRASPSTKGSVLGCVTSANAPIEAFLTKNVMVPNESGVDEVYYVSFDVPFFEFWKIVHIVRSYFHIYLLTLVFLSPHFIE